MTRESISSIMWGNQSEPLEHDHEELMESVDAYAAYFAKQRAIAFARHIDSNYQRIGEYWYLQRELLLHDGPAWEKLPPTTIDQLYEIFDKENQSPKPA